MSLHALAHHMATTGRGPDSTLVHMSPREVQGLQALAMANGGTLTINPQTGLPEAGFLDSILPALAGFALNTIAPGVGETIGGLFGASPAVGTGIAVGGATALASGDLGKGLMAGLGAYGGAGIGGSLSDAGKTALDSAATPGAGHGAYLPAANAAPASTFERLQAGAGSAMNAPGDFLDKNKWNLLAAGAPAFMDAFGTEEKAAAKPNSGYIRKYERDPVTGSLYQVSATPADQYTGGITFGGVPAPKRYDDGGVTFGGVGAPVDEKGKPIVADPYDTRTDSQKAQDYLMGNPGAVNPFLVYHSMAAPATTSDKAALTTANVAALTPQDTGPISSRALSTEQLAEKNDPNAWANLSDAQKADWFANPKSTYFGIPALDVQEKVQNYWASSPMGKIQNYFAPQEQGRALNITSAARMQQALANAPIQNLSEVTRNPFDTQNAGTRYGEGREGTVSSSTLSEHVSQQDRANDRDSSGEANGGLMNSHYAYGGGITALAGGGMYNLGSYSDGGRLLRGPGDGVSDDIPATIGENQPARLADGEFVVPARIVSELGNGSTEAGARKLYAMMDRVQKARHKTVGKDKVAANTRSEKYLPA